MSSCILLLFTFSSILFASSQANTIRICVPQRVLGDCQTMVKDSGNNKVRCIPGRDRLDCIKKIKNGDADLEAVDPEDMYLAGRISDEDFEVIKEIRTLAEPDAEFRYDGVAVVRSDLPITNIHGLRGLKSCHTGVGRNVGYKIPITKLIHMGIIGPLSDTTVSPRENELKALSTLFSKACIVGKWSPHPDTNDLLKKKYSNLCDLCEDPVKCDYPDSHSGYEGALQCLADGGDVAWTKVIYVKKFFGLGADNLPSNYSAENYSYLCPDGTKKPILSDSPCTWASRPWPGYMSKKQTDKEVQEARSEITNLYKIGHEKHAPWLKSVLNLDEKTIPKDNNGPYSPMKYLEKAKYVDVIERDVLAPRRVIRICVTSDSELKKCEALKSVAYARDIRPSLGCDKKPDISSCLQSITSGSSEVLIMDPSEAVAAQDGGAKIQPFLQEKAGEESSLRIAVVVPKLSSIRSMTDLKGKRACILPRGTAGCFGTLKTLASSVVKEGEKQCPFNTYIFKQFFSSVEESTNPLECLKSGKGDIAFVPYPMLADADDNLEAICSNGRQLISEVGQCDLTQVPLRLVMISGELTDVQRDDIEYAFLSAANLFGTNPDIFRMFGDFHGEDNVLFSNYATGLEVIPEGQFERYKTFKALRDDINSCNLH